VSRQSSLVELSIRINPIAINASNFRRRMLETQSAGGVGGGEIELLLRSK
jgi:hypothetical protein